MRVTDIGGIIAEIFALSMAYYTDPKAIFRILCGSIITVELRIINEGMVVYTQATHFVG